MLSTEFILTDVHFIVCLLATLAAFATAWLYLDAWKGRKDAKDAYKWSGFGLLAIGFLLAAVQVEPKFLDGAVLGNVGLVGGWVRLLGYVVISIGLALDPLQAIPKVNGLGLGSSVPGENKSAGGLLGLGGTIAHAALPLAAGMAAFLYWRRATKGLERHLKPVAWAMSFFAIFELLRIGEIARDSSDPRILSFTDAFGPLWTLGVVILLVGAAGLMVWVWGYLTKRLQTQLFMVFLCGGLGIFLVTTVSFTFLLMDRVRVQTVDQMKVTAKVLETALDSKEAEVVAGAKGVAQDPMVSSQVVSGSIAGLEAYLSGALAVNGWSALVLTNDASKVLLRGQDPARRGDSLSSDSTVARALVGRSTSGIQVSTGGFEPKMTMTATQAVRNSAGRVVGVASVGVALDNAFVDGLKKRTGLESALYGGNVRVAATEGLGSNQNRQIGTKETRTSITDTVIKQGKVWSGNVSHNQTTYLAVYSPLKDADGGVVGMLFVGQPQLTLLKTVGYSIMLTFLISALLAVISIWPIHLVSKTLAKQLD